MKHNTIIYVLAGIYALFGVSANYLLGFLSTANNAGITELRDAGAALVLPILTAFLLIGNIQINRSGAKVLAEVSRVNKTWRGEQLKQHFEHFLQTITIKCLKVVGVLGALAATAYLIVSGVAFYESSHSWRILLLLQALPLWILILLNINSIVYVYILLRKILKYRLNLSLFEVEKLSPINHFLFTVFFVFSGAIAIYALNILFIPLFAIDMVLLMVFIILMSSLLILPLNTLKTTLTKQKKYTLSFLNQQLTENIEHASNLVSSDSKRRLVDDKQRLQYVSDLLLVRKEIAATSSVPVSQSTLLKLTLLFLLPILSWVGAALVSQLLKLIS